MIRAAFMLMLLILTMMSSLLLPLKNVNAQDRIEITELADRVCIDSGVLMVDLLKQGVRVAKWTVKSTNLEMAANSGDRYAMGKSYPLWDWIPTQAWPGMLAMRNYSFMLLEHTDAKASLQFSMKMNATTVTGDTVTLEITKKITVYYGKYFVEWLTIIENLDDITALFEVTWEQKIGYTYAWCGIIGTRSDNDWQAWRDGDQVKLNKPEQKEHFVRRLAPNLKWIAVPDVEEGGVGAVLINNMTAAVWLEAAEWGTEVRTEFPTLEVPAKGEVAFSFKVYGGPVGVSTLEEAGFGDLARELVGEAALAKYSLKVFTDKLVYEPDTVGNYNVTVEYKGPDSVQGELRLSLKNETFTFFINTLNITISTGLNNFSGNVNIPSVQGFYYFKVYLYVAESFMDEKLLPIVVLTQTRMPLSVVFVWHHHQAPNLYPNATFFGPWAFYHTYNDEFKPYYEGGAYMVHVSILEAYPSIKMTYHLSPSLLWQWDLGLKEGWQGMDGKYVPPDDPKMSRVNFTLEGYKAMEQNGQIEIITSYFAHPIAGYVIDNYGWGDLLDYEMKLGAETTLNITGCRAKGMWTPEMFFSMELIDLMVENGIEYTILDKSCHFDKAEGDKGSIFEAYKLQDRDGREISVLFRDTSLSNIIGFQNRFSDTYAADLAAREYVTRLLKVYTMANTKIVPIALDGENWMIFSPTVAETPIFFERLCYYLNQTQSLGFLKTTTLNDALKEYPPQRIITNVPTTSWTCGYAKWVIERKVMQEKMWDAAKEAYGYLDAYKRAVGMDEHWMRTAVAMMHCVDSDFYWAEFLYPPAVFEWSEEVKKLTSEVLQKVSISNISLKEGKLIIEIHNAIASNVKAMLTVKVRETIKMIDITLPANQKMTVELFEDITERTTVEGTIKYESMYGLIPIAEPTIREVVPLPPGLSFELVASIVALIVIGCVTSYLLVRRKKVFTK